MPQWLPGFLMVLPSMILVGVFIYYLIVRNVLTSLTNRNSISLKLKVRYVGFENYTRLANDSSYLHAWWNLLVLTVAFLAGTLFFGVLWALLLEKGPRGEGVFRSVYLFPMAVSFIAASVAWKWLLNPQMGPNATGLNQLFQMLGLDNLQSAWFSSNSKFNMVWMALPAVWQLAGTSWRSSSPASGASPRTSARPPGWTGERVPDLPARAVSAAVAGGAVRAGDHRPHVDEDVRPDLRPGRGEQLRGRGTCHVAVVAAVDLQVRARRGQRDDHPGDRRHLVVPYLIYTRRVEKKAGP